jgi:hypothetical protein
MIFYLWNNLLLLDHLLINLNKNYFIPYFMISFGSFILILSVGLLVDYLMCNYLRLLALNRLVDYHLYTITFISHNL